MGEAEDMTDAKYGDLLLSDNPAISARANAIQKATRANYPRPGNINGVTFGTTGAPAAQGQPSAQGAAGYPVGQTQGGLTIQWKNK